MIDKHVVIRPLKLSLVASHISRFIGRRPFGGGFDQRDRHRRVGVVPISMLNEVGQVLPKWASRIEVIGGEIPFLKIVSQMALKKIPVGRIGSSPCRRLTVFEGDFHAVADGDLAR